MTDAPAPRTVAELVGHALAHLGARHCFGVVGSGNFAVTNALRAAGVSFTAARHEGGAATMADAYARMSGTVGLVSVHQGCGLTNAATGIGEAAKSRTPIIVLAAEATASTSNFAMDQPGLAFSLTADSHRLSSPESALDDVVRAFLAARDDRRTVVLNLPLDVSSEPIPDAVLAAFALLTTPGPTASAPTSAPTAPGGPAVSRTSTRPDVAPATPPLGSPDVDDVRALAELFRAAHRPVIVAGRGARHAGPQLRALGAASGALLATSAVANGLFEGDPFTLGISGGFSSPLTAELIANADLIVGFGCALNMWTMRHGRLIGPGATVVQVDLETDALGVQRPIALGMVGDSAATADAVLAELTHPGTPPTDGTDPTHAQVAPAQAQVDPAQAQVDPTPTLAGGTPSPRDVLPTAPRIGGSTAYRTPDLAARIAAEARWADVPLDPPDLGGPGPDGEQRIDPRVLSRELDALLPAERIVSIDSGNFMGYPSAYLRVPDEFGFCFTQAFQAIGLGLATAIGAALARPDRLPVLGTGDGGFLMGISELETAVRLRLPLVVIVYNDDAYGAEVHHFAPPGTPDLDTPDLATVTFPRVDIAAIARGFGADAHTVRSPADLTPVRDWLASEPDRPLVLDARIASDGGAWWLAEAFRGH